MIPFADALASLGLADTFDMLVVPSGYPSPKFVNLVVRRHGGRAYLFETSAARPDIAKSVADGLSEIGVERLDAVLVTHCHGDHGGGAGRLAERGYGAGEHAPVYLHSAGYRFLTHPAPAYLQETYELFLSRAHWGMLDYGAIPPAKMRAHPMRQQFAEYFARVPKSWLHFVDRGRLPDDIEAVFTPGHSHDCVLYFDPATGVAIPGDTILCTGTPEDPSSHSFVIPIFTSAGQMYSMAYERYLRTIAGLRQFFRTRPVRLVLPPHGRFAVTRPLDWVEFASAYFEGLYSAFRERFLPAHEGPFRVCDLTPFIPSAGAHRGSTPSHLGGMLCLLADEGWLAMEEDPDSRHLLFTVRALPPADYVTALVEDTSSPLDEYRAAPLSAPSVTS